MNNYNWILGLIVLLFILLYSCDYFNRDKIVDRAKLTGDDYRLFQQTPAWELTKAVWDQNVSKINKLLDENKSIIDFQEPTYGNTLLMMTIQNQDYKSFLALIENNANINLYNQYSGRSAIIEACMFDTYDIKYVKILLQKGSNVNDVEIGERKEWNGTRNTPLIAASVSGSLDVVKLLIKKGADVNFQNEFKQSALSESLLVNNYEVTLYLLENGADYSRPIFYREQENRQMYILDVVNENSKTSIQKTKQKILAFLKSKGIE